MITKAERTELRSIVRGQFKVLRAEFVQRQAELLAELEQRIADRYGESDAGRAKVAWRLREIVEEAIALDRQEADLLRTLAVGALESEEARAFLAAIPTVGQLVPAARLAELDHDGKVVGPQRASSLGGRPAARRPLASGAHRVPTRRG